MLSTFNAKNTYHSRECAHQADREGKCNKKVRIIDGRLLTSHIIAKRHKRCVLCDVEYCDVTSRNVGHYCSGECRDIVSVATRKAKGSYRRTTDSIRKGIQTRDERDIELGRHTYFKAGKRSDIGADYFRSSWEANIARLLNALGIDWMYEPNVVFAQ